jgi:hypothetical protein
MYLEGGIDVCWNVNITLIDRLKHWMNDLTRGAGEVDIGA